jgi:hypothetical protein
MSSIWALLTCGRALIKTWLSVSPGTATRSSTSTSTGPRPPRRRQVRAEGTRSRTIRHGQYPPVARSLSPGCQTHRTKGRCRANPRSRFSLLLGWLVWSRKRPGGMLCSFCCWDHGLGDEEDRLVLAAALLDLGDKSGTATLEATACAARGIWSVFAATTIYFHDSRRGLEFMLGILNRGDLEAQQSLVGQIWNLTHLPHAFTADGIHEARAWIESQLAGEAHRTNGSS